MAYETTGWKLWPGGSLVSGNIADDGAGNPGTNATGSLGSSGTWVPGIPYTAASKAAETTWVDCGGYDAVRILPIVTGTIVGFNQLSMTLWPALFDPLGTDSDRGMFLPRILKATYAATPLTELGTVSSGSTLPAGRTLNGAVAITSYHQPLVYPSDWIGKPATISAVGYERDIVVAWASGSERKAACHTLPLSGAAGMAYRVQFCNIDGSSASITGVGIRLAYQLMRVTTMTDPS